jgi:site-specific DNA recombinase
MRTLAYARRSVDDGREKKDTSVETQLKAARAYAEKNGWTVVAEHHDDGVSGAVADRRGINAVKASAARREFDVLVCADPSRPARELVDLLVLQRDLHRAGVGVHFYESGTKADMSSALGKVVTGLSGFGAEQYRELIQVKTRSKLAAKHEAGDCTGYVGYGYRRVEVKNGDGPDAKRSRVEIEQVPEQAAVIHRIFDLVIEGKGLHVIANLLTAEGAPAPKGGWTKSSVFTALNREAYIGRFVFGKLRNTGSTRTRSPARPALAASGCPSRRGSSATVHTSQSSRRMSGKPPTPSSRLDGGTSCGTQPARRRRTGTSLPASTCCRAYSGASRVEVC